jgi:hypothetical protein
MTRRSRHEWYEALQAFTEDDALHTANLLDMDTDVYNKSRGQKNMPFLPLNQA